MSRGELAEPGLITYGPVEDCVTNAICVCPLIKISFSNKDIGAAFHMGIVSPWVTNTVRTPRLSMVYFGGMGNPASEKVQTESQFPRTMENGIARP